jgi:hypothetical protein
MHQRSESDINTGIVNEVTIQRLPGIEERRQILETARTTVQRATELARRLDPIFGVTTRFEVALTFTSDPGAASLGDLQRSSYQRSE